jgi:16S rRNA pseudouridine516 synthase
VKLEDFISKRLQIGRRSARALILDGKVTHRGERGDDHRGEVTRFDEVTVGGKILQSSLPRLYLMLHKPAGILSATSDREHRTVLDLIDHPDKATLHLAGRLDRSSTGLILLSNDGHWTESLTSPGRKVEKSYLVETDRPIPAEAMARFAEGFPFPTEGITTLPARLEIIAPDRARVTLREGRYHQIKRMFHRLDGIRLRSLHRERIGPLTLPAELTPGQWRPLTTGELAASTEPENAPDTGID